MRLFFLARKTAEFPIVAYWQLPIFAQEFFQSIAGQVKYLSALLGAGDRGIAHDAGVLGGVAAPFGEFGEGEFTFEGLGTGTVCIEAGLVDEVGAEVELY